MRCIYHEWYSKIIEGLNEKSNVLELGSGGGFLREYIPGLITSEILETEGVDRVVDACQMPFRDSFLDGIVMTNVFHHIPDIEKFLNEATRTIKNNGKVIMIEPWPSRWSKLIYRHLHTEPFDINGGWKLLDNKGPLSGANGALPWIIFERDLKKLEFNFPEIKIQKINLLMPFSYLISGGVSMRSLAPGFIYKPIRKIENLFNQKNWAMFAYIEIKIVKKSF